MCRPHKRGCCALTAALLAASLPWLLQAPHKRIGTTRADAHPIMRFTGGLLSATFLFVGMATTVLGPLVPWLLREQPLSEAQVGSLFSAQFAASILTTTLSTAIAARTGLLRLLSAGHLLCAAGVLGLGWATWPQLPIASALVGAGLGIVIPATNLLVARQAEKHAGAALSILNFVWAVGATVWPLIVAASAWLEGSAVPAAVMFAGAGLLASAVICATRTAAVEPILRSSRPAGAPRDLWMTLILYGALQLLYVGTENAMGGWIGEHVRRLERDLAAVVWLAAPTVFWGALMIGRLMSPFVLRITSEFDALVAALAIATLSTFAVVLLESPTAAVVAGGVAGLGLSIVFPLIISAMAADLDSRAPGAVGPLFSLGGVGGATLPWLVGVIAARSGSLRIALLLPCVACATMLALNVVRERRR